MYADSSYEFKLAFKKNVQQKHFRCEHDFTFKNKYGLKYIVSGHQYDHNFYAIKFHLKKHSGQKNRFRILIKQNDAIKILNTVVSVMVRLRNENTSASFGLLECLVLMKTLMVQNDLKLMAGSQKSTYLIIDKRNNPEILVAKIEEIFIDEFQKD